MIEGVVFLVNTVEVDIASEKGVQIVVLAVRKCEEKFRLVQETFCEAMVDWKWRHSSGRSLYRPSWTYSFSNFPR